MAEELTATAKADAALRRLKRVALYVLLAAVIIAAWGIFTRVQTRAALKQDAQQSSVPIVIVTMPSHSDVADELVLPGDVQAFADAPIYARTSGYLKRWYADIGKHVKAGELLAEIETPEVDAQYRQAKADLATADATNRLSQTTAQRFQDLRKTGLVAQQDVDNAVGDAEAKKAQNESARQNLQRLEQMRGFNRITAPFEGVVTARKIDVGALVTQGSATGQELFHLSATSRLRVYVQVPQAYASWITPGMSADLTMVERPAERHPARVVSTAQAISATTRTLLTQLDADNPKAELLPGAYAMVHLPLPSGLKTWRLASNALLFRGDGLHVATVDTDNKVHLNTVTIGRDYGAVVEILSGVDAQDRIILNPPDSILDGAVVRIRADQP
ncbi:MAG TPA: efflux RND transporter periplasmic adaptor subunit [Steroidobacteraceae bacterium]|nr:efflux RND transporter periplasmic adaptor subunit [Steroidobacteraceae bacterium]